MNFTSLVKNELFDDDDFGLGMMNSIMFGDDHGTSPDGQGFSSSSSSSPSSSLIGGGGNTGSIATTAREHFDDSGVVILTNGLLHRDGGCKSVVYFICLTTF